jgi:type VI secretion system secreted protein VgrG
MSGSVDVLSITTPLPDTSFVITGLSGGEALSKTFGYTVFLQSGSALLDPNQLLDKPVTITLGDPAGHGRYISGIVCSVAQLPQKGADLWHYQLVVVPKLWFLGQTQDCRFFHDMAVPDVLAAVLGKFSIKYTSKLQATYSKRDYVVQFNESYLHFFQRLCEDEGIFYFFEHTQSDHTLILGDSNTVFQAIANPTIEMNHSGAFDTISSWHRQDATALGSVRVDDYNPQTNEPVPGAMTATETTVLQASGASSRTHYHWPAVRPNTSDAQARAKWRMLAAESESQDFVGGGHVMDFVAGGKFTLNNDPTKNNGSQQYIIKSVSYTATDMSPGASAPGTSQVVMACHAFLAATPHHPVPTIIPPMMPGLYTANVIGPDGEEIYVDDMGRIKVQFPWDSQGDITANNTFWARVVQPWAGAVWGAQFIPRIGMEVVVSFMEGDINRPVVVGCLYNGNATPIFAAADKNKTGFRTRSTKGGGSANYNELSFDDTMGSEVFFLHAEKDQVFEVEHDQTITVDNDQTETVKRDQTLTVNNDRKVTVKNDETITIQGKQTQTITGNRAVEISAGDDTLKVDGGSVTYEAAKSITLKVGDNSIVIDKQGITINGMKIGLTAQTTLNAKGSVQTSIGGTMVQVQADGMLELKGAVTMVNS